MATVVLDFFGDKFLGIECTLEAETSVSNLTQYKLFIGDDKKKMLSGVTFSFKGKLMFIALFLSIVQINMCFFCRDPLSHLAIDVLS